MRPILLIIALLALAGCSLAASAPGAVPPLAGIEGLSVMGTKKTLTDHLISFSSGKDCSSIRRERGQTYCVEDEVATPEEVYCYRTLGNVTCYAEPQKFDDGRQPIGHTAEGAGQPR